MVIKLLILIDYFYLYFIYNNFKKILYQNINIIFFFSFNRIDLPPYSTYTILKQKLLLAINEGGEGFSME